MYLLTISHPLSALMLNVKKRSLLLYKIFDLSQVQLIPLHVTRFQGCNSANRSIERSQNSILCLFFQPLLKPAKYECYSKDIILSVSLCPIYNISEYKL